MGLPKVRPQQGHELGMAGVDLRALDGERPVIALTG